MVQGKQVRNFTEGPIIKQMIKFVIPLMITGVMQLLFNTADTIVVGRWGGDTPEARETALAAVGSCGSLINMIVILFSNISLGAGVSTAQAIGAKKYDEIERIVHTSVLFAAILGVFILPVGFIVARPALTAMGTDPLVLNQAVPYMMAYFCGVPASMVYNYCAAIVRSSGETVRPMRYLFVAGATNVVFNLIAVLVFHLGAVGVGIATAVSNWVACILMLRHMISPDVVYHLNPRKLGIDGSVLKKMLRIGIPASVQGFVFTTSHVLIQSSVNSFGKAVVAGNAAAANLDGYTYQPMNAFYQAAVTFVGQHKGARKYRRMKTCILCCVLCVVIVGAAVGWLTIALGPQLLSLYAPENEAAIEAGMTRMMICTSVYFLCGLMEVGSGIMRGLGHSTTSSITSLVGTFAFRIFWILVIFAQNHSLVVLYLSYPITWILTASAHFIFSYFALQREIRALRRESEGAADGERVLAESNS
ncbi:MAG: MATE family efflux transporter [Ruminococcaceae bacterium]|nr:MATE family efflux transporter [Oscillospiraceae bacterium]